VEGHTLYIAQTALVEVVAAICRKEREQSITIEERDALITLFRQDSKQSYNIWPVTTDLHTSAGDAGRPHRLRAYDAVQLACALALREYASRIPTTIGKGRSEVIKPLLAHCVCLSRWYAWR
jgi:uncharacterized protein